MIGGVARRLRLGSGFQGWGRLYHTSIETAWEQYSPPLNTKLNPDPSNQILFPVLRALEQADQSCQRAQRQSCAETPSGHRGPEAPKFHAGSKDFIKIGVVKTGFNRASAVGGKGWKRVEPPYWLSQGFFNGSIWGLERALASSTTKAAVRACEGQLEKKQHTAQSKSRYQIS